MERCSRAGCGRVEPFFARLLLAKAVSAGVALLEAPRCVSYGLVAVFSDLCGNKRDVIERR
jgi:hypothetical protein